MTKLSPTATSPQWLPLIIVLAVLVVFGRLVMYDFILWDDPVTLAENKRMNPVTASTYVYYWTHQDQSLYIPITQTIWATLTFVARVPSPDPYGITLNPMVFRAVNVLVHAGSAVLAFIILRRLTRHPLAALLGSLVFALHPIQVESVGWISGLKDLLWGLFSLIAIYLYLRSVEDPPNPRRWAFYVGGMVALALAMGSKPTAMVTPALVATIDWFLLKRPWKQVALSVGPWLALTVPCMIVARMVQTGSRSDPGPLWARPLIVLDSINFYVCKIFWPTNLAPEYSHRPPVVIASGALAWTWIIPVVLIAMAIWQFRRRPWIAAGVLLLVIGTAPTLGFIPFSFQYYSTTADHYLYVSMFGVGVIVAYFIATTTLPNRVVTGVFVGVLVLLAGRSFNQAKLWADTRTLFSHNLKVNPGGYVSKLQLGVAEARDGDYPAAEALLREAVALAPNHSRVYQPLGAVLLRQGRFEEGIAMLEKFVQLHTQLPEGARGSLAPIYRTLARYYLDKNNPAMAKYWIDQALVEIPGDPEAMKLLQDLRTRPTTQP